MEQYAGNAGVGRDEGHVREERGLDLRQRRLALRHSGRQKRAKRFPDPGKDRHPDRLLVREVTKDCPLRDADPVGDGLRGDRIRPALAGQRKYRSDDLALSFVAAQTLARSLVDAALNIHDGGQLAFL